MTTMKVLVCAWLALSITACGSGGGGGDGDGDDSPPDASAVPDAGPPDALSGPCDPVAQTGCGDGEKCAWVDLTSSLGLLTCVPDGDRQLDETCTYGPDGEDTGFDDCVAGTACASTCRPVCALDSDDCGANAVCVNDANFGTPPAGYGVCQQLCNPFTQVTLDGEAACGSANPTAPDRGCWGFFFQEFRCAGVPAPIQAAPDDYAHGDAPLYAGVLNGCAPGFGTFLPDTDGVGLQDICVALCRPGPTSQEDPSNANGLVGSGDTCAEVGATAGDECRYLWYLGELYAPNGTPLHLDGIGVCWNPEDLGEARCSTIPVADQAGTGCAPYVP
jgi:hypothetical protein